MSDLKQIKQQLFSKAYLGLQKQEFKQSISSINVGQLSESHLCVYKAADGTHCAVGQLIVDEVAAKDWSGSVDDLYDANADNLFAGLGIDRFSFADQDEEEGLVLFLSHLQEAHDLAGKSTDMENLLRSVAKIHKLEVPQ